MEQFGKLMFTVLITTLCIFSTSHAAVILWSWFVVPYFHISPITWRIAYGFILILGVIHSIPSPERKDTTYSKSIAHGIEAGIIAPWISVLIGWIIR